LGPDVVFSIGWNLLFSGRPDQASSLGCAM
jgi:hypothetical protein